MLSTTRGRALRCFPWPCPALIAAGGTISCHILTAPSGANPSCCHHQPCVATQLPSTLILGPCRDAVIYGLSGRMGAKSDVLCSLPAETAHPNGLPFHPEKHTPGTGQSASRCQQRVWSLRRRRKRRLSRDVNDVGSREFVGQEAFVQAVLALCETRGKKERSCPGPGLCH